MISFDDFQKLDLRVAKVIEVERVEGSEKLLKLQIGLGREQRQILAGLRQFYQPEELIGKEIIVVTNLEPRVIFGLESRGMLLAADDVRGPVLLVPDREVNPGTRIH